MRFTDRSRTTTDWKCPRRRYLAYEQGGRGWSPSHEAIQLFLGSTVHDGLAAIAVHQERVDIDHIATTAFRSVYDTLVSERGREGEIFATEQATLIEGMIRGFHKFCWPRLFPEGSKVLAIEQEMEFRLAEPDANGEGLTFMCKPDLVIELPDGRVFYIEYKTTSTKKAEWVNSWGPAVQLHSTLKAIEKHLGVRPDGVIVQGLYKGYVSYGKQSSPFCYAYARSANPPFTASEVRYDYAPGFKRVPIWQLDGGVKAWVDGMPDDVLVEQFPCTPPIFVREDQVETFFLQVVAREMEIELALDLMKVFAQKEKDEEVENIMNTVFPQHFEQCIPSFGAPCPYNPVCHGPSRVNMPQLGFEPREAHHEPEAKFWKLKEIS